MTKTRITPIYLSDELAEKFNNLLSAKNFNLEDSENYSNCGYPTIEITESDVSEYSGGECYFLGSFFNEKEEQRRKIPTEFCFYNSNSSVEMGLNLVKIECIDSNNTTAMHRLLRILTQLDFVETKKDYFDYTDEEIIEKLESKYIAWETRLTEKIKKNLFSSCEYRTIIFEFNPDFLLNDCYEKIYFY